MSPVSKHLSARSRPDHEAFRLLQARQYVEALPHAERAIEGAVECVPAHGLLATLLVRLGRRDEAEQVVLQALSLAGESADAWDALANVSLQLGEHERACELYRKAADLAAGDARLQYNLATSERSLGRLDAAERACERAITADAAHLPSWLLRSELRAQTSESNHVAQLRARLDAAGTDDRTRMFLGYALGKELDDLGRYDEAFECFATAAAVRRRRLDYDVAVDVRKLARIAEVFPSSPPPSVAGVGPRDVFVVGLPRSGTTLVERILTGHSRTRSNGETESFSRALFGCLPEPGADAFARAAAADPESVASAYRGVAGGSGGDTVVEKLPLNYLYAGAIARCLPSARLVLLRRNPEDVCFAMFRTLFGEAYPFSYDFSDLARYYAAYHGLVAHWQRTLGARLHVIDYEALVATPAIVGAVLAEHCGLEWHPESLLIASNPNASMTASASQVRRPIYDTSVGRWQRYRRHLAPLVAALEAQGVASQSRHLQGRR